MKRLVYFAAMAALVGLKWFYSRAGADDLEWILGPSTKVVALLSGISFQREVGAGWISHEHTMIVGPACSGLNFMLVSIATLFFSLAPRIDAGALRWLWLFSSIGLSYLSSIGANALRIAVAVRLHDLNFQWGWFNPERIHRAEGTAIYFLSLLCLYGICMKFIPPLLCHSSWWKKWRADGVTTPLSWYLGIVLGVPMVNGAYRQGRFFEHSILVLMVCGVLIAGLFVARYAFLHFRLTLKKRPKLVMNSL
jgi:exosortase K